MSPNRPSIALMLDTGSEANLIKLRAVPNHKLIKTSKLSVIKGIDGTPLATVGTIQVKIANFIVEFLVVPDSLRITHDGILGSEFFVETKSKIDFKNRLFKLDNISLEFKQEYLEPHNGNPQVANVGIEGGYKHVPFIKIFNPFTNASEFFLVDTGSEPNLIKKCSLPSASLIDTSERALLKGLGSELIPSLGNIKIKLFDIEITFQVIPDNVNIPGTGILGTEYLQQAQSVLDFEKNILETEDHVAMFSLNSEISTMNPVQLKIPMPTLDYINYTKNTTGSEGMSSSFSTTSLKVEANSVMDETESLLEDEDVNLNEEYEDTFSIGEKYNWYHSQIATFDDLNIQNFFNEDETKQDLQEYEPRVDSISVFNVETTTLEDLLHTDHLDDIEKNHVLKIARENRDRFFLPGDELPGTDLVMHRIPTTDDEPTKGRQYKFPHALKDEINRQVEELLNAGIIKPSHSQYNTPVWIVKKKPDSQGRPRWRMVLDFRALNEKTINDAYPLPNITEILDQVGSAKYYTVLDLASGFHQIRMDPRDAHKTAFSTPYGHYEFCRMPFGLKNAPGTFQRLMDNLLRGLQGVILFVYLDDIVIYANSLEEHEHKFKLLVERLRLAGLKLQIDKCEFLRRKVNYLGHMLSEKGLSPDPKKVEAVKDFPQPKDVKNVRQFLGLAGYYRRFIKNFAQIAKPLTKLLQKEMPFEWNEKAEDSFNTLKTFLCNAPLLQFPDFTKPFNVTTDASGYAIGGVLSQGEIGKDRPIAYTSRVLRGPELKYEVYEKEALAVLHSVNSFRSYVYGRKFTIITDHQPLVWFKTADLNIRIQKWRFKLSEYDYTIVYKPGKLNSNADALSRNPTEPISVCAITRAQKKKEKPVNDLFTDKNPIHLRAKEIITDPKTKGNNHQSEPLPEEPSQRYPKRNINKNLNYFESDTESGDEEGEARMFPSTVNSNPVEQNSRKRSTKEQKDARNKNQTITPHIIPVPSTSIASLESADNVSHTSYRRQIVETREAIQYRTDNIAYFITNNGLPCDEGARKLLEFNKISPNQSTTVGEVKETKKGNNRHQFSLCIRGETPESMSNIKANIFETLKVLRDLLLKLNQKEVSIAKSKVIENLNWSEVLNLIDLAFSNTQIKILICTGTLTYVPPGKREEIFYESHKSPVGGHKGVSKTYNRIKQKYYWENLKEDVRRRIQQCLECQLKKLVRLKTKQPMIITDTPGIALEKIAMDIVGPLKPTKNGNEYILTIQDQLSKFCLAVPLSNTLSTTIADAFIKKFICVFGAPKVILTDQGQNFLSNLMTRVAKRFRIKKLKTTAFHPQSNGSLERSHHTLSEFLKQYTDKDNEWDDWLDIAMLSYNTCTHESTKHTPYEVIFGRLARLPSSDPLREGDVVPTYKGYMVDLVTRLNGIQKLAYDNLVSSKFRSKKYYDRSINPKNFHTGDYVFLLSGPKPGKFGHHYTGPHKILEILNKNNIKIQTSKGSKIVHANRLRISHINHEPKVKKQAPKDTDDE